MLCKPGTALEGREYWRSLEELTATPEFRKQLENEFPEGASRLDPQMSRRELFRLMTASLALAGLTACRRPEEKIVPYVRAPENVIPGIPKYYSTSMERGGLASGVMVESHEGRPTKIEGNPEHPANLGALDAMSQAAILELYDPDRSQGFLKGGEPSDPAAFKAFAAEHFPALRENGGSGLAFLSELTSSPSLLAQRDRLLAAYPQASWHVWEPVNEDQTLEGVWQAFGLPLRARYAFDRADVVVSLGSDFLGSGGEALIDARRFTERRRFSEEKATLNRLYVVEPVCSLTGAMADNRLRMPADRIAGFALALAAELEKRGLRGAQTAPSLTDALRAQTQNFEHEHWVREVATDLVNHLGRAIVIAGPSQPPLVHALVCLVNQWVAGDTVRYVELPDASFRGAGRSIADLATKMRAGEIKTLAIVGGNPVYDAPADLGFAELLGGVEMSIHLSLHVNETSAACSWHAPRAHTLEVWGDARSADGTIGMIQPLIAPLFGGIATSEFLAIIEGEPDATAHALLLRHYGMREGERTEAWHGILHDGLKAGSQYAPVNVPPIAPGRMAEFVSRHEPPAAAGADRLELVFLPDPMLYDGRYANNGWLQETPDPVSKIVWDNVLLMSLGTAQALGLTREDLVEVSLGEKSVPLPVWILPGMADWTMAVHLGYGRTHAGRVGNGVGRDVYPLRTLEHLDWVRGVTIRKLDRTYPIACVQSHWSMEGRNLIREQEPVGHEEIAADHGHEEGNGHAAEGHGPAGALWHEEAYDKGPQWGMAIDLNACIGCEACMVACQAENNVPIVGKKQVSLGREMHWLRIDRYFVSPPGAEQAGKRDLASPGFAVDLSRAVFQPIPCMHCETAPCEQVCPVAATVHDSEGLNVMVYNRCIGTRYCLNNCPYKVRRFNFFNYTKDLPESMKIGQNPDVTVRSRGVMEKCTYCTQRINEAKHNAKREGREVRDGEFQTACQQTCPTRAIEFGDIRQAGSRVSLMKAQERNYTLLDDLNTRPRTSYQTRLRNPNPALGEG